MPSSSKVELPIFTGVIGSDSAPGVGGNVFELRFLFMKVAKNPGCMSESSCSSGSGNLLIPSGGCWLFLRTGVPGLPDTPGIEGVRELLIVVRLLRMPSNSTCSFSPIGCMLSCSSRSLLASSICLCCRALLMLLMIALPPLMASALGSYSGSSCSATVRIWSRSPLKTAVSGTSFADFDSCSSTTPAQISKKPNTTVSTWMGEPLKPR